MTWQEVLQGETDFLKRGDKEEHIEKNKINQNGFKVATDVGGLNVPVKNTKIGAFPGEESPASAGEVGATPGPEDRTC